MVMTLSTAANDSVTMRPVSPVLYENKILFFTAAESKKYQQMKANPHCCVSIGAFFAEAKVTFCGSTMLPENEELRSAYDAKFPGAFDEGMKFGGRDAEFILLIPEKLTGWTFEDGSLTGEGIPTVPFEIVMNTEGQTNG